MVQGAWVDGDVEVTEGVVTAVGLSPAGRGGWALPGFVDRQVNGSGAVNCATATESELSDLAGSMAERGTTAFLPTIANQSLDGYLDALTTLRRPWPAAEAPGPRCWVPTWRGPS